MDHFLRFEGKTDHVQKISVVVDLQEDRRVIYVGNIPEGTTRDCLRCRFQKFGMIDEVSVHFRDNRYVYRLQLVYFLLFV